MQWRLWTLVLLFGISAPQALAQTLSGSCTTGYSSDQLSLLKNNVVICNGSTWLNLLSAPSVDAGYSIAVGNSALSLVTTGNGNTAVGGLALSSDTTGSDEVAVGMRALQYNTTGNSNTALGFAALYSNTSGVGNTAVGLEALEGISTTPLTGNSNVGVGAATLQHIQGATQYNTVIGANALAGTSAAPITGNSNTVLGYNVASTTLATGNNNILIGTDSTTDAVSSNSGNTLNIGNALFGTNLKNGNNTTGLALIGIDTASPGGILDVEGGTAVAATNGATIILTAQSGGSGTTNGGNIILNPGAASGSGTAGILQLTGAAMGQSWQTGSDARIKQDIAPIHDALNAVAALNGVTFTYRPPADREVGKELMLPLGQRQIGVIAQNLKQVFPEAVGMGQDGVLSVNYGVLIAPLIEAIKTLKHRTDAMATIGPLWVAVALLYVGVAVLFVMFMAERRRNRTGF